jgi:DNA-directed RNA polymerase II subunit RPB3
MYSVVALQGIAKEHVKWPPCSVVSFDYDPHDRLRHHILVRNRHKKGVAIGHDAAEEELQRDEPFDYNAKPQKSYFEVETDGSLFIHFHYVI